MDKPFVDPYDFMAFIVMNMRHHLSKESPKIICDFHKELCEMVQYERVAICAPRGHAKSTIMTFFYSLFLLLERPGTRIAIVSATYSLSEYWASKIRLELETNPRLISRYGEQNKDKKLKWTNELFELPNGSALFSRGYGQQVRGFRPDVIINDDIETDERVVSEEQRNKFDKWFDESLTNTMLPGTQMITIGTLLHPESFLANIINDGRYSWETRFYAAIMDGKSIWPEMWPMEELMKRKREIGEYAFAQEFLNDPLPDERRTFQKQWIKTFDELPKHLNYFMTVDPAIKIGNKNDYTAIVIVGVDEKFNWYVVTYTRRRLLPKETVDLMFSYCSRYNIKKIGIEEVGFQEMLSNEFKEQRTDRGIFPIVKPLKSGGRRKSLRIESLQPRYESGKVYHAKGMDELELELLRFPSPRCHDDLCDALAYMNDIAIAPTRTEKNVNPESFEEVLRRRRDRLASKDSVWGFNNIYD